jgi:demethylsterigmatocystin 6-O-methyltransferase
MAFPSFLKEGAYQGFAVDGKTSFQKGHATELGAFQWLSQHPKNFGALQIVMTALQSADWLVGLDSLDRDARDVAVEEEASSSQKIFFVDVGGGHGHQCRQLLEKYPNLMGRLVLQDLPQAVDKLGAPINGVKVMAQDFFEKQSVEGRFVLLRQAGFT